VPTGLKKLFFCAKIWQLMAKTGKFPANRGKNQRFYTEKCIWGKLITSFLTKI